MPGFELESIDHVALAVSDVAASRRWYEEVLGLERRHAEVWGGVPTMMGVGSTLIALFPRGEGGEAAFARGGKPGFRHLAFRAGRADFDRARAELARRGLVVEFADHGICHSIYFHDPDGYELEITTYEV